MINLADIIYAHIRPVIESWTEKDIYAISFFVYDDEDDEKKPTVIVGYNTEAYFKDSCDDISEVDEVRWNYAYWPQNEEYQFGYDDSADIVRNWIIENGYENYNTNEEIEYDEKGYYIGKGPFISQKFVEQLIIVAQRLHQENVIIQKFGKSIPILIHELEYYQAIADETKSANPEGIADEFINWVNNL